MKKCAGFAVDEHRRAAELLARMERDSRELLNLVLRALPVREGDRLLGRPLVYTGGRRLLGQLRVLLEDAWCAHHSTDSPYYGGARE